MIKTYGPTTREGVLRRLLCVSMRYVDRHADNMDCIVNCMLNTQLAVYGLVTIPVKGARIYAVTYSKDFPRPWYAHRSAVKGKWSLKTTKGRSVALNLSDEQKNDLYINATQFEAKKGELNAS